jgi:hypothetical protein
MEGMESSELTTIVNQVRSDVDPAGQSRRINIYREIVTVGPGMSVNAAVRKVNNANQLPAYKFLILCILAGADATELQIISGLCFRCRILANQHGT